MGGYQPGAAQHAPGPLPQVTFLEPDERWVPCANKCRSKCNRHGRPCVGITMIDTTTMACCPNCGAGLPKKPSCGYCGDELPAGTKYCTKTDCFNKRQIEADRRRRD